MFVLSIKDKVLVGRFIGQRGRPFLPESFRTNKIIIELDILNVNTLILMGSYVARAYVLGLYFL